MFSKTDNYFMMVYKGSLIKQITHNAQVHFDGPVSEYKADFLFPNKKTKLLKSKLSQTYVITTDLIHLPT